jgi:hypothetical protein
MLAHLISWVIHCKITGKLIVCFTLFVFRQYACPRLPPDKRPKYKCRQKSVVSARTAKKASTGSTTTTTTTVTTIHGNKSTKSTPTVQNGDHNSSSESEEEQPPNPSQPPPAVTGKPEAEIEPKGLAYKPKGLIDGLSQFFTPSNKRKSRVSLNTDIVLPNKTSDLIVPNKVQTKPKPSQPQSKTQQAASRLLKKSRVIQANKGRRRQQKQTGPPGSGQLKGLFDGLSHLFAAPGETRKRSSAVYAPPKRMRFLKFGPNTTLNSNQLSELGTEASGSQLSEAAAGRGRGRGAASEQVGTSATPADNQGPGEHPKNATTSSMGRGRGRGRGTTGKSLLPLTVGACLHVVFPPPASPSLLPLPACVLLLVLCLYFIFMQNLSFPVYSFSFAS